MSRNDKFDLLDIELRQAVEEIRHWYDVDKVKPYSVYIWTKDTDDSWGENVFDIMEYEIVYYVKDHVIPDEVMPIVENIQEILKELRLSWIETNEALKA